MPRILVIAPESDLRRSMEFALSAEGHRVTCRTSIGTPVHPANFDCTVLDHHAIGSDLAWSAAFCRAHAPVVLLADAQPDALAPWVFRTVLKPQLGSALVEAVRAAVATRTVPK